MVKHRDILAANALISEGNVPLVSVFAGGTAGIGRLTLRALVATGASVRIYLVGRKSSEERIKALIQECKDVNLNAEVVWVEGEISLMADTRRVCDFIKEKETKVDLLFLTAGYAPFGARQETEEGIEVAQALEYYSRVLFAMLLLPLLHKAEAPRVVSVGGGGLETASMEVEDIDLKKPGNFGITKTQVHYLKLNSVALDKLAADNSAVTFIHSWPGWVNTGNVWRGVANRDSLTGWLVWLVLEPLISFFSFRDEEAAQRHLFIGTSAAFGGRGAPWTGKPGLNNRAEEANGLFLVNYKCDCTPNAKALAALRENAQPKVWAHTQNILRPYL